MPIKVNMLEQGRKIEAKKEFNITKLSWQVRAQMMVLEEMRSKELRRQDYWVLPRIDGKFLVARSPLQNLA